MSEIAVLTTVTEAAPRAFVPEVVAPLHPDLDTLHADDGGRALFERLGPLVYSYCRRKLADSGRAEEVAQDVLVAAWQSKHKFDPARASLSTWVMGIARFKVMDAYRASARTPLPVDDTASNGSRGADSSEDDHLADRLLVADALAQLGPRASEAIRLSFYESMTHEEIAAQLGLPLGTIKSDIRRGLLRLRQLLGNNDPQ